MDELNFLSLNVRGLRESKKRREIFRWLKRYYNAKKCFTLIQECHTVKKDEELWKKEWGANIIFSHATTNSKGVAILCPLNVNTSIIEQWSDDEGQI